MKSYSPKLVTSYRLAKFPCMDCKERKTGCHSNCKKYQEAKDKNEENRLSTRAARYTDYNFNASQMAGMARRGKNFRRSYE